MLVCFWFVCNKCHRVQLLGQMTSTYLVLEKTSTLFSRITYHLHPHKQLRSNLPLHHHLVLCFPILTDVQWRRTVVLVHILTVANDVGIFYVLICHMYLLFSDMSIFLKLDSDFISLLMHWDLIVCSRYKSFVRFFFSTVDWTWQGLVHSRQVLYHAPSPLVHILFLR